MNRRNFALVSGELWRPPGFRRPRNRRDRLMATARRALDPQAASIWRDLRVVLPQARGAVLDVGAGAQPYRQLLPKHVRYAAIDIKQAGDRFGYDAPDTTYFDGHRWPVETQTVDLVLATETLEHVDEPQLFLDEARRVLRADGRLLLTVPFSARWHYVPFDYWRFTPSSLSLLLQNAGFGDVAVYARGNELTVACSKVMALIAAFALRPGTHERLRRAVAAALSPIILPLALVSRLSLRGDGGDDCLGWTVTATVAAPTPPASPR